MPIFLISPQSIQGNRAFLDADESHHLTHVLRKKAGDKISLTNGEGDYFEGKILETKDRAVIEILSFKKSAPSDRPQIILAPALLKNPRMDWLIEKATELGASAILPFLPERSVVKIKSEAEKTQKIRRWQRIAASALKQSAQSELPRIGPILSFEELLRRFANTEAKKILFSPEEPSSPKNLEAILKKYPAPLYLLAIGPEGGWSRRESAEAKKAGFESGSLGDYTLRAETAAIAALAVTAFVLSYGSKR